MMQVVLTTLAILWLAPAVYGKAQGIAVSKDLAGEPLGLILEEYVDLAGELKIQHILQKNVQEQFESKGRSISIPGFIAGAAWGKFTLSNHTSIPQKVYLEHRHILTKNIVLYEPTQHGPYQASSFDIASGNDPKLLKYRNPVVPITVPPGNHTYYLKITGHHKSFEFYVWSPREFQGQLVLGFGIPAFLIGGLWILLIYIFVLMLTMRNISHLFFITMMVDVVILEIHDKNIYRPTFLDPENTRALLVAIAAYFSIFFATTYLNTKEHFPKFYKRIMTLAGHLGFVMLLSLVTPINASIMSHLSGIFAIGVSTIAITISLRNKIREAYHLVFAGAPVLSCGLLIVGIITGIIPGFQHHEWLLLATLNGLVITFSLGLGDRLVQSIEKANKQALEFQKKQLVQLQHQREASAVQKGLLGHESRVGRGAVQASYRSADATGGDWYGQFHDRRHGRIYLLIGDVTGHGTPSALVTSAVAGAMQATIETLSQEELSQDEALVRLVHLADLVVKKVGGKTDRWMSMSFIAIDEATLEGSYLNAGHPQSYIMSGGKLRPILAAGSLLGFPEPTFGRASFSLQEGDILFMYTDGLLENRGPSGERMTVRHLLKKLQSSKTCQSLVESIEQTTEDLWSGRTRDDDVTMLAFQVLEPEEQVIPISNILGA